MESILDKFLLQNNNKCKCGWQLKEKYIRNIGIIDSCSECGWNNIEKKKPTKIKKEKRLYKIPKKYSDYLKTDWWIKRRKLFQTNPKNKFCFCCGERTNTVHHIGYKNIGREKDEDLVSLCYNHHEEVHEMILNDVGINYKNAHIILKSLITMRY